MRNTETTSDRIIERVATLWANMLRNPKFDNGDTSSIAPLLAISGNAHVRGHTLFDAKVEMFRVKLTERLKFLRDNDGKPIDEGKRTAYFRRHLSVDYDPDETLRLAAEEAGFERTDKTLFPWKTDTSFYGDWVSVSAGYGAPDIYHYPMSGNRWLICRLRGEDMVTIIQAVENGELDGMFQIEVDTP